MAQGTTKDTWRTKNIDFYIQWYNRLSSFVATEICIVSPIVVFALFHSLTELANFRTVIVFTTVSCNQCVQILTTCSFNIGDGDDGSCIFSTGSTYCSTKDHDFERGGASVRKAEANSQVQNTGPAVWQMHLCGLVSKTGTQSIGRYEPNSKLHAVTWQKKTRNCVDLLHLFAKFALVFVCTNSTVSIKLQKCINLVKHYQLNCLSSASTAAFFLPLSHCRQLLRGVGKFMSTFLVFFPMHITSLIYRSILSLSLSITLAGSQSVTRLREMAWSVTADLFCCIAVNLLFSSKPVTLMLVAVIVGFCCDFQQLKKRNRVRVIEYFVDVAKECVNIGNFNSLMAIIGKL